MYYFFTTGSLVFTHQAYLQTLLVYMQGRPRGKLSKPLSLGIPQEEARVVQSRNPNLEQQANFYEGYGFVSIQAYLLPCHLPSNY